MPLQTLPYGELQVQGRIYVGFLVWWGCRYKKFLATTPTFNHLLAPERVTVT